MFYKHENQRATQAEIDGRNARYLMQNCPDPAEMRLYIKVKPDYELLVRCGWNSKKAAKEIALQQRLSPKLTFSDYQIGLAKRVLAGEFPWVFKRMVTEDNGDTYDGEVELGAKLPEDATPEGYLALYERQLQQGAR